MSGIIKAKIGGKFKYQDDMCVVKQKGSITYEGELDYCPYKYDLDTDFYFDEQEQVYICNDKKQDIVIARVSFS